MALDVIVKIATVCVKYSTCSKELIKIVVSVVVWAQVDAPQDLTDTNGLRHRSCGSSAASGVGAATPSNVSVLHCVWHLA